MHDTIRSGINIFGQAVDRIINTFASIEDRIRALLEFFRKQLLRGVPKLGIPIMDPLYINKIELDINHEAATGKGNAEDITVEHISKFIIEEERFSRLGNWRFKLDLNLTFPYIKVNGKYKIDGLIDQTFEINGSGPFSILMTSWKMQQLST
ncbi:hypothetical protein JTB14_009990 [Gonioctena quinquepunctata]|nr:hypothetical protein JTB14_009990 [Gonioctena quinquepunctata]